MASTQKANTGPFAFIAVLVLKLLFKEQLWTTASINIFSSLWRIGALAGALKKLFLESRNYEETGLEKYEFPQILK